MPEVKNQPSNPTAPIGVLLCNLGTPDAPTPKALRRYLREFLSDPRVVELSKFLWLPILYGVILTTRPKCSAAAYAKVWTKEGSPLMAISKRQAAALASRLKSEFGQQVCIELAMRYGQPSIPEKLQRLRERGVQRLLIFPLYPQYAAATTASVFDRR